jgi:hypothetical protein
MKDAKNTHCTVAKWLLPNGRHQDLVPEVFIVKLQHLKTEKEKNVILKNTDHKIMKTTHNPKEYDKAKTRSLG